MGEGAGKQGTVNGLEDLRALMDALLLRVNRGGSPREGVIQVPLPLIFGSPAPVSGDGNNPEAKRSRIPERMEIRCLNPQTLGVAREDSVATWRKVERYFHRSPAAGPRVRIFCIRRDLQGYPVDPKRRVHLHVVVKRRYGGPGGILPQDALVAPDGSLQPPGKGSRPREAEA